MSADKYRLIFSSPVSPAEAFGAAGNAMRDWLTAETIDAALLSHTAASSPDGGRAEQWRLREGPRAVATLTVHAPASSQNQAAAAASAWFWLEAGTSGVLGLIRALLDAVDARDSLAVLATEPTMIGTDRLDELIDILCDPERRLPAMVATAHPSVGRAAWKAAIAAATRSSAGLASTYLLDDEATIAFTAALGVSHGVWGGALRTYLPEVDPAVPSDGLRHRVMLAGRISADPHRVAEVLADLPRRLALESPMPLALAGVNRLMLTQDHREAAESAPVPPPGHSSPPPAAGPAPEHSQELGRQARRIDRLRRERDDALALAEQEEARANSLFSERETILAQLAEREQQVLHLESTARAYRQRLLEAGVPAQDLLHLEAPPDAPPGEFAELLDWIELHLPRVEFTGEIDAPLELDSSPEASTWVRSTWEALRALQAYAEVKAGRGFPGDFRAWCKNPPSPGEYIISPNKAKMDESETVHSKPKWRQERVFRVPAEVEPGGRVFMGAHITIGASASGRVNPRLYFHDAVLKTGKVYVGYIGRHLTNTLT
jgi:hypothetical protein